MPAPIVPPLSTSILSAAGNASIPSTPGGRSGLPRKPRPGTGTPDINEASPQNLDHEAGSADPARSELDTGQETTLSQDKQTDYGAPRIFVTNVGHRSHQPRKKVATPRPITGQDSYVVFYEEQLERLRNELSRASTRADELQQHHDAQSKVLDSAHSQLKIKTEQITNTRRDYEKLQGDFSASSAQLTNLQRLYDVQSQDILSTRNDLQARTLLLEEKEHVIISLSDQVAQVKHENSRMADQVATAQGAVGQLRVELSSASSRIADVQKRYEAQSQEFDAARDELRQLKGLYQDNPSGRGVADQIKSALKEKNQQIEVLRKDLAASTSRNDELQKSYETLSKDVSDLRDELKVKTSHCESTITSLNAQVERWKSADGANKEQIATSLEQVKGLQDDLSSSTSQLAQLQGRYDVQSRELAVVRNELQSSILSSESKERTIVSLTTEVAQWKDVSASKTEQLATAFKRVEELQRDPTSIPRYIELQALYEEQTDKLGAALQNLSTSASDIEKLRNLYEERSDELTAVRKELNTNIASGESKDLAIAALNTEVQQWKEAGASESKRVATILEKAKRLEDDLSTSTSKLGELQHLYEEQSSKFVRVRGELQTSVSSAKDKDLTISTLTNEIEQWRGAGVDEPKKIRVILELVKKLRGDISISSSKLDELQDLHKKQSNELASVRDDLEASLSSGKDKDLANAALTDEVRRWKDAGANESKQVATLLEQAKRLQDDLTTSTSELDKLQNLYQKQSDALTIVHDELQASISSGNEKDLIIATLTAEVGQWKGIGVDGPKGVVVILEQVERLLQERSTSTSQLAQLRTLYEEQSRKLTIVQEELQASTLSRKEKDLIIATLADEVQQWKDARANESKELAAILEQVGKLQANLTTSVSEHEKLHNLYEEQSNKLEAELEARKGQDITIATLTDEVQRWKDAGANESKQVATILEQVDKLHSDLSTSATKLAEFKDLHEQQSRDLANVREELQVRTLSEEGKARELAVTRKDLEQLRGHLATAASQMEHLKESELATADELTAAYRELEQLHRDLSASSSRVIESQQRYEAQSSQLEQWKNSDAAKALQLSAADEKLEQRRQELSTLSSQLDKVHRFFTIADTYADTTIIQMVQKLNAEVQQNTTFIAECILDAFQPHPKASSEEENTATQRVSVYIGQALADSLKKHDDLALYLPIAFQAYLTYYLSGVISAWTTEEAHSDLIDTIYQRLQRQEAQTISGHWRSLTRTYISPTCRSHPDIIISSTIAGLSDILVAAGCATSASAAKSMVTSKFLDKVSSIISIAGQLSKMIGEVVSSDFKVLAIRPDVVFEGTTMEEDVDDYDDIRDTPGGTAAGEKVLCSTQLGLTKRMPLESGRVTLTAMRTKVLLESFLIA